MCLSLLLVLPSVCLTILSGAPAVEFDYFGASPPGKEAEIFAPGIASTEYHDDMYPVFAPDGRDVILRINGRLDGQVHSVLYLAHRDETGDWGTPEPLSFLTHHRCGGANFSPDGSRIFFTTRRPLPDADPSVSKTSLWFAQRMEQDWSEARPVASPINNLNLNGGLSIAADGTMYAALEIPGRDSRDIYVLECVDGEYPEYRLLPGEVNTAVHEVAPYVNSDKGYLLVTAVTPDGLRIQLSVRGNDGAWLKSETVDELTVPEAKFVTVSPDGKYVFFVSHRQSEDSNPAAVWTIAEFDSTPMEGSADIFWMKADFLMAHVAAMKTKYGVVD